MICFHPPCSKPHQSVAGAGRPSHFRGTRKHSVPGRVHSVRKSFGFISASFFGLCVQPVFDSRHGRITCKTFSGSSLSLIQAECGLLQSDLRAQSQPLNMAAGRTPKIQVLISLSPVVQTSAWHRNPRLRSSDTRPPWLVCTPALWLRSRCWFLSPCGHTTCGTARRNAERNWPPPQRPRTNTYFRTSSCSLPSSCCWRFV